MDTASEDLFDNSSSDSEQRIVAADTMVAEDATVEPAVMKRAAAVKRPAKAPRCLAADATQVNSAKDAKKCRALFT